VDQWWGCHGSHNPWVVGSSPTRPTVRNRIPFELEELADGTSIVTAEARFAGVSEPLSLTSVDSLRRQGAPALLSSVAEET
jgi:hypothetical protein